MFGQAPRLVAIDRKLAGPFIQEHARGAFQQHRGKKDRDDLPEQAEAAFFKQVQSRSTGTFSM